MDKTEITQPKLLKFRVGTSSFAELVERDQYGNRKNYFVDKTLFIKEFLEDSSKSAAIMRSRRFGKSLNLDMLRCFFAIDNKEENRKLFTNLQVATAKLLDGSSCMDYQGQYPVIHLSFKDLKQDNIISLKESLKAIIAKLYKKFIYLIESGSLTAIEKAEIKRFLDKTAPDDDFSRALALLIDYLHDHHNRKVMVLLDEYDVPFQTAIHLRDYGKTEEKRIKGAQLAENLAEFFTIFLGSALKDNVNLEKALMTGVVRIAGAGVFSGLNNINFWTVLDDNFSKSFGFTADELTRLLKELGKTEQESYYKRWYNGYQFGSQTIYNPWSVMLALERKEFAPYWLETSNNDLVRDMLLNPKTEQDKQEINTTIAELLGAGQVTKILHSNLVFDSRTQSLEHLWILLLSAGYLKAVTVQKSPDDTFFTCTIAIPNMEVSSVYKTIFLDWIQEKAKVSASSELIQYLLTGEPEAFCQELRTIFQNVVSSRDAQSSKEPESASRYEAFYHGFMIGLLALSLDKNQHKVLLKSNRESGQGFYDLVLEPLKVNDPLYHKGVIFEFKHAKNSASLRGEAHQALTQIKTKEYVTNMQEYGVKKIVCIGMAFYQKQLEWTYEIYEDRKYSELITMRLPATVTPRMWPSNPIPSSSKESTTPSRQQESENIPSIIKPIVDPINWTMS